MSTSPIDTLFNDNKLSVITFSTNDAAFAIPLEQVLYIEKDVKRNIQVKELKEFNHEVITYQNNTVQLYDFNRLVGSSNHQEKMNELVTTLNQMETSHKEWLDALEDAIKNATPFTKQVDPNLCEFGRWYNQFETDNEELSEIFERFDEPHKKLHSLAGEILKLNEQNHEQALKRLEQERHSTLSDLIHLFHLAKERALNSIRPIILFVEHHQGRVTALRLDNINDIVEYDRKAFSEDDSVEGIMKKKEEDFVVEGFLRNGNSAPLMLINCKPFASAEQVA